MRTVAVIPAFNEERRISDVVVQSKKYVDRVIVVDDGSDDRTAEVSKRAGAEVIRYENNRGKGHAFVIGLKRAISLKPKIIVFLDADGQHNPKYIPLFVKAIENGADYASAKRNLSRYPFSRKLGNWGLTLLANLICPTGILDTENGFRSLSIDAAKKLRLLGGRYETEMDFVYNVWKNKFKVRQIEIQVPVFHSKAAIRRGFRNFFFLVKRRFL